MPIWLAVPMAIFPYQTMAVIAGIAIVRHIRSRGNI
jgi:hypothetical protein